MTHYTRFFVSLAAGCAAAAAVSLAPTAVAQGPNGCTNDGATDGTASVCDWSGSAQISVTPQQIPPGGSLDPGMPDNGGNGPYGPLGNTPPAGHH